MPRRFQKGHQVDDVAGHLEWGPVEEDGTIALSAPWVRSIPWLKGGKNARDIAFWLCGEGRVQLFDAEARKAMVVSLIGHATDEIAADASLVWFKGNFQADNRLAVPDPVAAHVLAGSLTGPVWLWSHRGVVELWDEQRRLERVTRAMAHVATRVPEDE